MDFSLCRFKKGEIYYFDSVGDDPPPEVQNLIERFRTEGAKHLNKKIKVHINRTVHQLGNTECGIYCLAFIHHMLTNGDFNILQKRVPDDEIAKLRAFFFDDVQGVYDNI